MRFIVSPIMALKNKRGNIYYFDKKTNGGMLTKMNADKLNMDSVFVRESYFRDKNVIVFKDFNPSLDSKPIAGPFDNVNREALPGQKRIFENIAWDTVTFRIHNVTESEIEDWYREMKEKYPESIGKFEIYFPINSSNKKERKEAKSENIVAKLVRKHKITIFEGTLYENVPLTEEQVSTQEEPELEVEIEVESPNTGTVKVEATEVVEIQKEECKCKDHHDPDHVCCKEHSEKE